MLGLLVLACVAVAQDADLADSVGGAVLMTLGGGVDRYQQIFERLVRVCIEVDVCKLLNTTE